MNVMQSHSASGAGMTTMKNERKKAREERCRGGARARVGRKGGGEGDRGTGGPGSGQEALTLKPCKTAAAEDGVYSMKWVSGECVGCWVVGWMDGWGRGALQNGHARMIRMIRMRGWRAGVDWGWQVVLIGWPRGDWGHSQGQREDCAAGEKKRGGGVKTNWGGRIE
jgi:hypothetical protein